MPVPPQFCPGPLGRRDLLQFGFGGLGGLGLAGSLAARSASAGNRPETAVILVFCHGGASHVDTYDLKPEAPAEIRGPFKPIPTNVAGISISELFPLQSRRAHRFSLIRSVSHRHFDHQDGAQMFLTGRRPLGIKPKPDYPDFIGYAARLRETTAHRLPAAVGLPPVEFSGPGFLGPAYAPFRVHGDPDKATFSVPDLTVARRRDAERVLRRHRLRESLDRTRRDLDENREAMAADQFFQRAVDMVTTPEAAEAFSLAREADATRDRYGRHRWGQSLLLARRLVEAGVSVVTVALYGVPGAAAHNWDDHAVNWHIFDAMKERAPHYDQALSALIDDLFDRGLDRRVLVIAAGEFGRTPKIEYFNGRPGRDHYAPAMSILVSGGGLKMGQVVGSTDSQGAFPDDRPLAPENFLRTVYDHLQIDTAQEFVDPTGRPLRILDPVEPIRELV